MAEVGRTVPNTIGKAPITFAMIELAETPDCNARKSQWLRYGFKDVTPMFAGQSTVPSLDDSMTSQGRTMLTQMVDVMADWFMVSGHHGAIYSSDYNLYTTDGQPVADDDSNLDWDNVYNSEQYCGFFNESYHISYWDYGSRDHHDPKPTTGGTVANAIANAIYLRTTDAAPASICSISQDNPLFDATSWAPEPKGIILSACNCLAYKSARKTWGGYFPNAVIIGPTSRIVSGTWVTNAIAAAQMTDQNFWRNPQAILDQPGKCSELEKQLTANFPSDSQIGFIYKGKLFVSGGMDAGEPL
jgi:hypothetical protein